MARSAVVRIPEELTKAYQVDCPECEQRIKTKNLKGHIHRVHHASLEILVDKRPSRVPWIAAGIAILLVLALVSYQMTSERSEGEIGENPPEVLVDNWWADYTPEQNVGSQEDDWWDRYPDQHPDSGGQVNHTDWVRESLDNKVVLILDHSEGCSPCLQQQEDIDKILESLGNYVKYLDIMADGSDERSDDVFELYDPDSSQHYIPLTVIVTITEDQYGGERVLWHSAEGATGEQWLRTYLKDAIYYQKAYSEE